MKTDRPHPRHRKGRTRLPNRWREHLVFEEADLPLATEIIAEAAGIEDGIVVLRALVKAGYAVVPRVPSNAMLAGYCRAYGSPPQKIESCIVQIGKARKRWHEMMKAGSRIAFTRKRLGDD